MKIVRVCRAAVIIPEICCIRSTRLTQNFILIVAVEAQSKITPIFERIYTSSPEGSGYNHAGLAVDVFQTVTVTIGIDRLVGTFISRIGSMLMVNVSLV